MDEPRTLLAITSYNQIAYTRECFKTLGNFPGDIVCLDDVSVETVDELCREFGVEFMGRKEAKGLTYSWNTAYRMFLERGYDNLIISNNDVLFPEGSLATLIATLKDHQYVGVLTRLKEPWNAAKAQAVERHYDIPSEFVNEPQNYQRVQSIILNAPLPPIEMKLVYGFCFGVNRSIVEHQFSENHLFDPANINVGQEDDLAKRSSKKVLCRAAFVYHYKSTTFGEMTRELSERRNELDFFR